MAARKLTDGQKQRRKELRTYSLEIQNILQKLLVGSKGVDQKLQHLRDLLEIQMLRHELGVKVRSSAKKIDWRPAIVIEFDELEPITIDYIETPIMIGAAV